MSFLYWCGDHPWLFVMILLVGYELVALPVKLVNRWIRHRNIIMQGWPPVHVDADGDPVKEDSE